MPTKVLKTVLEINSWNIYASLQKDIKILCVQNQNDRVCLWYEGVPDEARGLRKLIIVGTGYAVPVQVSVYIGTVQINEYVWHIYDTGEYVEV